MSYPDAISAPAPARQRLPPRRLARYKETGLVLAFQLVLLAVLLAGCGFIDEMKGSLEKSQVAAKVIKEAHGWEAQVGGQMLNGKLVVVTVMLDSKQVGEHKVAALEKAVTDVLAKVFQAQPETLLLQIASGQTAN